MKQNPTIAAQFHKQSSALHLGPLDDGKSWVLLKQFDYELYNIGSGIWVSVPANSVTDLASTPRYIWSVFPPWERYGKAAIVHDYLYHAGQYSRKDADKIMREIMLNSDVDPLTRWLIYTALRLFGWIFFKSKGPITHVYNPIPARAQPVTSSAPTNTIGEIFRTIRRIVFLLAGWGSFFYVLWRLIYS
jgi:hypothetical protein